MNQEQVVLVGNIAILEGRFQVFLCWICSASCQAYVYVPHEYLFHIQAVLYVFKYVEVCIAHHKRRCKYYGNKYNIVINCLIV